MKLLIICMVLLDQIQFLCQSEQIHTKIYIFFIVQIQMTQYHRDEDLSFMNDSLHNPLAPITNTQHINKNPISLLNKGINHKTTNTLLNILSSNRSTNKLQFNEEFQQYLALDDFNSNLNIVTFIGSKQVGKSFLIDFLISKQQKSPSRLLSKNSKMHVNMPTFQVRGKNGQKILYLDTSQQVSNQIFLWTYFLSSIMVLNLGANDKKGQEQFIAKLDNLRINLNQEELSLPQLIVLRRDSSNKEEKYVEFLRKIESYGLFSEVNSHHIAYPGTSNVTSKDIRDVAENLLNQAFINDALNLNWQIKSTKPKTIQGNILGSKITGIILQPLTKSINKTGKVDSNKIWSDVIQTLSVGYYNYYIKKYSEQLQNEFADEQPCDKYTLYKKLSKVKRVVNKKVEGFNSLLGDQTFERYREKLLEKIVHKEKIIKQINRQKSIKKNSELSKHLFAQITPQNCQHILQQYCDSKFDDSKAEVLLQSFETVINKKLKGLEKTQSAVKPSLQIKQLENELIEIKQKVQNQKKLNSQIKAVDISRLKDGVSDREGEVKTLEAQLSKQRHISNEKKMSQSNQARQLENRIQELKKTIKEQQKEIQKLKKMKESEGAAALEGLNRKLKQEQDRLRALEEQVRKLNEKNKQINPKPNKQSKDSCCSLM